MLLIDLAGLLACDRSQILPIPPAGGQWCFSRTLPWSAFLADWDITYSYGDSAGLTPDFPFHPDHLCVGNQIFTNVGIDGLCRAIVITQGFFEVFINYLRWNLLV